eukprot:GHVN01099470.1.p1 GENE.GHVN01099470.1~~GHVN01099470.1.p1  ORF type:complete len:492 (+),score=54.87 GHVN01099470.1:257-1732(+)
MGEDAVDSEEDDEGEQAINLATPQQMEGDGVVMTQTQDLEFTKKKLKSALKALANWASLPAEKKAKRGSRDDVVNEVVQHAAVYYGYSPDLAEYFISMLGPQEGIELFEASEKPRPTTLRVNMLKSRRRDVSQRLTQKGVMIDPVGKWTNVGLKVYESQVPLGATPEYLAGHYMLQSASSLLPVIALAPRPGERILDMAAAPGGKSTHIGQLMKNDGVLFCNDSKRERTTALVANLHRLGVTNAIVTNVDGRKLGDSLPKLDRVLLDAPCTGSGIVSRDQSIKVKRGPREFVQHSALQKELLAAAVDLVDAKSKTGGYIVYSTCSISVEENEAVVDHILKTRHVKVVPMDVNVGSPGITSFKGSHFSPSLKEARRLYPHKHNMDGFFVVKLRKMSNNLKTRAKKDRTQPMAAVAWGKEHWTDTVLNTPLEFSEVSKKKKRAGTSGEEKGKKSNPKVKLQSQSQSQVKVLTRRPKQIQKKRGMLFGAEEALS